MEILMNCANVIRDKGTKMKTNALPRIKCAELKLLMITKLKFVLVKNAMILSASVESRSLMRKSKKYADVQSQRYLSAQMRKESALSTEKQKKKFACVLMRLVRKMSRYVNQS